MTHPIAAMYLLLGLFTLTLCILGGFYFVLDADKDALKQNSKGYNEWSGNQLYFLIIPVVLVLLMGLFKMGRDGHLLGKGA